jgi:hypothetical protein
MGLPTAGVTMGIALLTCLAARFVWGLNNNVHLGDGPGRLHASGDVRFSLSTIGTRG